MSLRVLVVEDDPRIAVGLSTVFADSGFDVATAPDGEDGYFRLTTELFDLLVLDVGLPGRDGFSVLQALRQSNRDVPVLILSSHNDVDHRVRGLRVGADDYMTKPFEVSELLARADALLRRGRNGVALRLKVGDLFMDLVNRHVTRGERPIELTVREFELLEYLMRHGNGIVSRDMLARDVWKECNRVTPLDNVIDVHIARLRKKIDGGPSPKLIHTVRGVGFCLSESEPM
jgi:two-component system, OmpR family, copper resistance phosphate regulon response regulator CusR